MPLNKEVKLKIKQDRLKAIILNSKTYTYMNLCFEIKKKSDSKCEEYIISGILKKGVMCKVECSPMVQETVVQSQTQKCYLMLPCLTVNIIRYESR